MGVACRLVPRTGGVLERERLVLEGAGPADEGKTQSTPQLPRGRKVSRARRGGARGVDTRLAPMAGSGRAVTAPVCTVKTVSARTRHLGVAAPPATTLSGAVSTTSAMDALLGLVALRTRCPTPRQPCRLSDCPSRCLCSPAASRIRSTRTHRCERNQRVGVRADGLESLAELLKKLGQPVRASTSE